MQKTFGYRNAKTRMKYPYQRLEGERRYLRTRHVVRFYVNLLTDQRGHRLTGTSQVGLLSAREILMVNLGNHERPEWIPEGLAREMGRERVLSDYTPEEYRLEQ